MPRFVEIEDGQCERVNLAYPTFAQSGSEGFLSETVQAHSPEVANAVPVRPSGLCRMDIEGIAVECRQKWGVSEESNLGTVVAELGGRIAYTDKWDDPYSTAENGSIWILPTGCFTIWLSPRVSEIENRFIIAHELGHLELQFNRSDRRPSHKPMIAARYNSGPADVEANIFAMELLIPKSNISEDLKFGRTMDQISRKYLVSQHLVHSRLSSLGLRQDQNE